MHKTLTSLRSRMHTVCSWKRCLVLLIMLQAADAFARAGGGGRYSGGGGSGGGFSGGSGGSGGDGIGVVIYLLLRLIIARPLVGIPVALVVVFVAGFIFLKGGRGAVAQHQSRVISRASHVRREEGLGAGVAAICERDRSFDPSVLGTRIQQAFIKVQEAWCAQEMEPMRPFVTDGIFERFSLQIQELQDRNLINRMENLQVEDVTLVEVRSDAMFDTVTYCIRASAIDEEVDRTSGKRVSGGKQQEAFAEYWSFIRRPGSQTSGGSGLMEGNCPNCGSLLQMNQAAKCQSCGALVKSGEYDWVLAEITQACEWQPTTDARIPGLAELRTEDPAFSIQHLEDRASVIFWRLLASWREGRIEPVRKMATESFCAELKPKLQKDAKGIRQYPGHCAVGAVTTRGIKLDQPLNLAVVEVRWSSYLTEEDASGQTRQTKQIKIRTEVLILGRCPGVRGNDAFALASAHCPGCGSAVHESASNACDYCGAVLNEGDTDWVLLDKQPLYSEKVQALLRPTGAGAGGVGIPDAGGMPAIPASQPGSHLEEAAWMVSVMVADGDIDPKEREQLEAFARSRGVTASQVEQLISSAQGGNLEVSLPQNPDETRSWLESMIRVALADGKISAQEKAALQSMGKHIGFSGYDLNQLILKTRSHLFKESRQKLRSSS